MWLSSLLLVYTSHLYIAVCGLYKVKIYINRAEYGSEYEIPADLFTFSELTVS
jgi:hypothetical protein